MGERPCFHATAEYKFVLTGYSFVKLFHNKSILDVIACKTEADSPRESSNWKFDWHVRYFSLPEPQKN